MNLSDLLKAIRFPLAVLVVITHVLPFSIQNVDLSWDIENIYAFISEFLSHGISSSPTYFVIAGYLFYYGKKSLTTEQYKDKLSKRVYSLVIPYFLWNGIAIITSLMRYYGLSIIENESIDWSQYLDPSELFIQLWHTPADYPLWFIRDLICISIIAPVLHFALLHTRGLVLIGLFTLYIFGVDCGIPGFSTIAISFFSLGIYLGSNSIDLLNICNRYGKACIAIWLVVALVYLFNNTESWSQPLSSVSKILGVFVNLSVCKAMSESSERFFSWMCKLAPTTFFIYACHLVHIEGWFKGFFSRIDFMQSGAWQFIPYFSIPILTILTCLGLYYGLKRFAPNILAPLVGNRSQKD